MSSLSRVLVSALSRRTVAARSLAVRRMTTETTISGDAVAFGRMLRKDPLLLATLLAFGSVFTFVHYSVRLFINN